MAQAPGRAASGCGSRDGEPSMTEGLHPLDFSRMLDAIDDPELSKSARDAVWAEHARLAVQVEDVREAVILALLGMGDPSSEEHMVGVPRDQWETIVAAVGEDERAIAYDEHVYEPPVTLTEGGESGRDAVTSPGTVGTVNGPSPPASPSSVSQCPVADGTS